METLPTRELPRHVSFEKFGGGGAVLESVTLDHISEADIARITEVCNQPKVHKWVTSRYATGPGGTYTDEDARNFVETANHGWAFRKDFAYAIRDENGRIVGTIGLRSADAEEPEVGYWADTTAGEGGYVTNALLALCDVAASHGYSTLCAFARPKNDSSRNVLKRAGFTEIGIVPYTTGGDNLTVDAVKYTRSL